MLAEHLSMPHALQGSLQPESCPILRRQQTLFSLPAVVCRGQAEARQLVPSQRRNEGRESGSQAE